MRRRTFRSAAAVICVLCLLLTGCAQSTGTSAEKVSAPFEYSGYSEAEYSGYVKTSQYVEMDDGTKLAVDVYLPEEGPDLSSFPVLFQYTPYGRAYAIPEWADVSILERIGMKYYTGTWGNMLDRLNSDDTVYGSSTEELNLFLSHGYAYVCADMRGCGASYGSKIDFCPEYATDGRQLIDWIAAQDWCDGNVGMFGGSYLGYTQWVTAEQQPEALKAIVPEMTPLDGYTGEIRPGGIFLWAYSQQDMQIYLEQNCYMPDNWSYPTCPAVDEDGDGDYFDEIPLDLNGNGSFLDDYNYPEDPNDEPQYADGQKREHIYYLASYEHKNNVPYNDLGPNCDYIDSEFTWNGETMTPYEVSPSAGLDKIMESGIAVYSYGGWMDAFTRGNTEAYGTLNATNPTRLMMGAGYHMETSPYWDYCGEDEDEMISGTYVEKLRFFDRYLKGIDNGIDTESPVLIYNMNGDGWREENEWPLARQVETTLYMQEGNFLSTEQSTEGSDVYTADFTTSNYYGEDEKGARYLMETPDTLPVRTEMDNKCLTYTTASLQQDTEVTGYPIVDLYVSSTADTGDFYVYLEDVDEKGEAVLVSEGMLNAQFAALQDNDDMVLGGAKDVDILPDLPWHGYEEGECDETVLADGKIVQLKIDLQATSWTFKQGHRIRISVACADNTIFELTPELCPNNNASDEANIVPDITVYRDAEHPTSVTLPVIPKS